MKIQIKLLFIFCLLISISAGCESPTTNPNNQIKIVSEKSAGDIVLSENQGTAFFADSSTLITSYHTVQNTNKTILPNFPDIGTHISQISLASDIVYLELSKPLEITNKYPQIGIPINETSKLIGSGIYYFDSSGKKVAGKILEIKDNGLFFLTDIVFSPKESGSPIYLKQDHRVIGLANAINTENLKGRVSLLYK